MQTQTAFGVRGVEAQVGPRKRWTTTQPPVHTSPSLVHEVEQTKMCSYSVLCLQLRVPHHVYIRIAGGIQGMSPQRESRKLRMRGFKLLHQDKSVRRETFAKCSGNAASCFWKELQRTTF